MYTKTTKSGTRQVLLKVFRALRIEQPISLVKVKVDKLKMVYVWPHVGSALHLVLPPSPLFW